MTIFLVIFMFAAWSSIFSIGKWTLEFAPPIFLTASRMLLAGALMIGYLCIRKRSSFSLTFKQFLSLILLGIFSIYLTNICEFWGLQHLTAAKTCFIYSLSPFLAAFFSYLHFKEKMNKAKWIGMLIGFIGFLPVLTTQTGSEDLFQAIGFISWPELAVMGAALFSVYGWVLLRLVVKNHEVSSTMANGTSMLIGGSMALFHSFFIDSWAPFPVEATHISGFLKGTLIMAFISNILCYNLYGFLLKRFTATFLSFMGLLSPIFASLNSWILLGEKPSWLIFLSTSVISIGLWIIYREELRQGYIRKPSKQEVVATDS